MSPNQGTLPRSDRDGINRRKFIQVSTLGAIGLTSLRYPHLQSMGVVAPHAVDKSCILIVNVGGPSQLDTFDPKPNAPREVRGPFSAIPAVGGDFQLSELLPRHAALGAKFSVVRGMHHVAPPLHDLGHQLAQTGRLLASADAPHIGCALSYLLGRRNDLPPHVVLPKLIGQTGGNLSHGQDAAALGAAFDPFSPGLDHGDENVRADRPAALREALELDREPCPVRDRYGASRFGRSCLQARRLVERGVRFVTLNAFTTVFHEKTWDTHGGAPYSTMADLRDVVAPDYDRGYSALLEDLHHQGLLDSTLVVSVAEFGRTPKINSLGGRDHWPHCWTATLAGGGIQGGRAIGASDRLGAYPAERGVQPKEILATIYHAMGIALETRVPGLRSPELALVEPGTQPILELF